MSDRNDMVLYWTMIVATVFVALFVASFIKDLNDPAYDIPPPYYGLLAGTVGLMFGFVYKRSSDAS